MENPESKRRFQLQFVADEAEAEAILETDVVVVWPSKDPWNDQGYRLLVEFKINADDLVYKPKRPAAMLFDHFRNTREGILSLGNGRRHPSETDSHTFASLQMEVNEYRNIGRALGRTAAILALEALHDVVVEERKAKPRAWLEKVKKSEAFYAGLLRPTSRYFAYRRGYDFLIGNEVEAVSRSSASAELTFQLDAFGKAHEIPLSFGQTETVNRRINVLIGRNGVGKSQTLSRLVTALAHPTSSRASIEPKGEFNRVIAFSGIAGQTSLPRSSPASGALQYHFYNLSPGHISRKRHPVTAAMVDIMRSTDYLTDVRRLDVFSGAVRGWVSLKQIYLPLQPSDPDAKYHWRHPISQDGVRYISVDEIKNQYELQQLVSLGAIDQSKAPGFKFGKFLSPLSSGQELFFRFALHLCTSIDVGTLVLIDEPENHLHPNFITGLMALLRDVLSQTGSFALIASHSPFVVREVTHHDVIILERDEDGLPTVRRPRLRTLGASVAAVSLYVFGDETISTLTRLTLEGQRVPKGPMDEDVFGRLAEIYSNEAISYIRSELFERQSVQKPEDRT
jgi:predicted ATPase